MKRPIEQRVETIKSLLKGEVNLLKTAELLGCSQRTVRRYRIAFLEHGQEGLKDHRCLSCPNQGKD